MVKRPGSATFGFVKFGMPQAAQNNVQYLQAGTAELVERLRNLLMQCQPATCWLL